MLLSPMAGVTDVAFRTLCKSYGAALTCTEFVSSAGLVRGTLRSEEMLVTDPSEKPVAVQLFGSSIHDVVEAARLIEDRFDIIDVNCGCPAWKVVRTGAGSALLEKPKEIGKFVSQLTSAVSKPVTVKIRKGLDEKHSTALEIAKIIENCGASAIAIHGRTQVQGYSGEADWEIIRKVKEKLSIPVLGNGDVFSPEVFTKRLEESKVDGILLARGVLGKPFLFQQIQDYLKKGSYDKRDSLEDFFRYLNLAKNYSLSFSQIKQHALSFTHGREGGARLREKISACKSEEKIETLLKNL